MNSIHKNNLVLAIVLDKLKEFNISVDDCIEKYDKNMTKTIAAQHDTWESSENFIRDLRLIANDYYKRVKSKTK